MFLHTSYLFTSEESHLGLNNNRRVQVFRLHTRRDSTFQKQAGVKDKPGQWLYIATNRLRQYRQPRGYEPKDHCLLGICDTITSRLGLSSAYPRRKQRIRHLHQYTAWEEPFLRPSEHGESEQGQMVL